MSRAGWLALLVVPAVAFWGCGGDDAGDLTSPPRTSPPPPVLTISAISPVSATAGTGDLTLTVTGANFADNPTIGSRATWAANGDTTSLTTRFVSSAELTAVVPAALLSTPLTANVFVLTGEPTHGFALSRSNAVSFRVDAAPPRPPPLPTMPSISGIWPPAALTHSRDLTVAIGGDFDSDTSHRNQVVWAANGDTTLLATDLVDGTALTAVVPTALLRKPVSALVFVQTWDPKSTPLSKLKSNTLSFSVASQPPPGTGTLVVHAPARVPFPRGIDRGYRQIALDGSPWRWLLEGDRVTFSFVAAGDHQLRLSNPCTFNHQPSAQQVTVMAAETTTVEVTVPRPCQ